MGYSFRLTARVHLYAPSHRQDSTYHGLCYNSRGALAGCLGIKRAGNDDEKEQFLTGGQMVCQRCKRYGSNIHTAGERDVAQR